MKKLFLIEDDRELCKMYSNKFSHDGWEVAICHDGSQAVSLAKVGQFDMIVLDLMLPGLSGIDILEMLRSDRKTALTPIIVYTNYGDVYNREKCLTYGADEFVLKVDSTPQSLTKTIERVYEAKNG